MCIKQEADYITLDQDQYVKNIVSRFEKSFKHKFKTKESPLLTTFVPSKKDCPAADTQLKEVKIRFCNLNHRSIIGALSYVSCCTCPDITYAVNKFTKYENNPGIAQYQTLLHLIRFIEGNSNKGIKFYQDVHKKQLCLVLSDINIKVSKGSIIIFTDSSWNDCAIVLVDPITY